ncbi:MAG TPA: hypothetical protein VNT92_10490, partial [Acidimicrobiia bacterium]|nr:hypothetical protein [Acidimicrobiia bacterium]
QLDVFVGYYPRIPLRDALELYCGCLSHLPNPIDAVQIERRAQGSWARRKLAGVPCVRPLALWEL